MQRMLQREATPGVRDTRTRKILLVDDNEAFVSVLQKLLSRYGHEVEAVHSGSEALEALGLFAPEVIFLDIGMPEMDGYATAREIRGRGWRGFLVALTGYGQEDDRRRSNEAGFDRHVTKPVGIDELQQLLQEAP